MVNNVYKALTGVSIFCLLSTRIFAANPPVTPKGDPLIKDLNTPRDFPNITSRQQWQQRAHAIREHVLVSCGLWPMPQKTPLKPQIFGRIERDGYSVEKV